MASSASKEAEKSCGYSSGALHPRLMGSNLASPSCEPEHVTCSLLPLEKGGDSIAKFETRPKCTLHNSRSIE